MPLRPGRVAHRPCAPCRYCDPGQLDAVEARNGLSDDELVGTVEYLVLGHFEDDDRDVKGYDETRWLGVSDLDAALEPAAVDAALEAWELHSSLMRRRAVAESCDGAAPA